MKRTWTIIGVRDERVQAVAAESQVTPLANAARRPSAQTYARIAGVPLRLSILGGGFGEAYVPSRLIVSGDAAARPSARFGTEAGVSPRRRKEFDR